jgi:hypothetical protein
MFRFAQVVLCVSITVLCLAGCQVPIVKWDFISYVDSSSALATQQTSDGGYMLAGYTYDSAGVMYAMVVKTDALGDLHWNKTYPPGGPNRNSFATCIISTNDGNYMICENIDDSSWSSSESAYS